MYRNAFAYRKPVARKPSVEFPIALAWAAVAAADRVNAGQYVNDQTYFKPEETRKDSNKVLAFKFLENPDTITAADRVEGQKLADHFAGLLFRSLSGNIRSGFLEQIAKTVAMESVGRYEVACMAALPKTYRGDLEREAKNARMATLGAQSAYLGSEGDKLTLKVKVLETFYSQNYNSHIITAVSDSNIIKFFTTKSVENFPVNGDITVQGRVKRHSVNDRTSAKETWLTRVKIV
jgi:hypothetical protein